MGEKATEKVGRVLAVIVCVTAVALLVFHTHTVFQETWSDENIHMYVASRVADGASLYGEIPSSRPPLAITPLAGLIALGVPPLLAARAVVFVAVLLTGAALLWAGHRLWGRTAAVSAFVLYILSAAVASRTSFTGIQLVELWSTLGVLLAVLNLPLLAGLAAGTALMTGQHAVVLVCLSFIVLLLQKPRNAVPFAGGCAAVVGLVVGCALAMGSAHIWTDLVARHLYHAQSGVETEDMRLGWFATTWMLENLPVLLPALFALVLGTSEPRLGGALGRLRLRPAYVLGLVALAHVGVVIAMKGGQILYVQPAFPLFALLAGAGVDRVVRIVKSASERGARISGIRLAVVIAVCTMVAVASGWIASSAIYSARDHQKYSVLPHLRIAEMSRLQLPVVADQIAEFARQRVSGKGTIFGHATIADLVALKSGKRVSGELADFAPRWLEMGVVSRESVVERIEADGVELFVTPNWFWVKDDYFATYLKSCYEEPVVFQRKPGSGIPRILAFLHKRGTRPCQPG